jgi:hypothetical protein
MDLELVNKSYFNEGLGCKFEIGMLLLHALNQDKGVSL